MDSSVQLDYIGYINNMAELISNGKIQIHFKINEDKRYSVDLDFNELVVPYTKNILRRAIFKAFGIKVDSPYEYLNNNLNLSACTECEIIERFGSGCGNIELDNYIQNKYNLYKNIVTGFFISINDVAS